MSIEKVVGPYRRFKRARATGDEKEMRAAARVMMDAALGDGAITVPVEVTTWLAWNAFQKNPGAGASGRLTHRRRLDAVRYVMAVRAGMIKDHTALITVAEAFDESRETVKKWIDRYKAEVSLDGLEAEVITDLMETAAMGYVQR